MKLLTFQILGPLLRLRQACSHPQAVRGQFITATKATMSMEELLESLIKKTQSESEESLRQYIAALNGMIVVVFCLSGYFLFFFFTDTQIQGSHSSECQGYRLLGSGTM